MYKTLTIPYQIKAFYSFESEFYHVEGSAICVTSDLSVSEDQLKQVIEASIVAGIMKYGIEFLDNSEYINLINQFIQTKCNEVELIQLDTHLATKSSDGTPALLRKIIPWNVSDVHSKYDTTYDGCGSVIGQFPLMPQQQLENIVNEEIKDGIIKYGSFFFNDDTNLKRFENRVANRLSDFNLFSIEIEELSVDGKPVKFTDEMIC